MHDLRWIPIAVGANRGLAWSAMPDAPVVPARPRRERRRLRGFAERLVGVASCAGVPRRLGKEQPCGT